MAGVGEAGAEEQDDGGAGGDAQGDLHQRLVEDGEHDAARVGAMATRMPISRVRRGTVKDITA